MKSVPDTALAREAARFAEASLSQVVFAHSLRTFFLGRGYAERRAIAFDEEGLFLAAVFHDLGLVRELSDGARAFTEVSAQLLRDFLAQRDEGRRGTVLAEAIELHMQLAPRWSRGPEVGLLQVGAWMDVTGLRSGRVGRPFIREVEHLHPRGAFGREFRRGILGSLRSFRAFYRLVVPKPLLVLASPRGAEDAGS